MYVVDDALVDHDACSSNTLPYHIAMPKQNTQIKKITRITV